MKRLTLWMLASLLAAGTANAIPQLYWTNDRSCCGEQEAGRPRVNRVDLDGSNREVLVTLEQPNDSTVGIALDLAGGKMYLADGGEVEWGIARANLDGTGFEYIVPQTTQGVPTSLALDTDAGKIYWIDAGTAIMRSSLDGSTVETFLAVDPSGGVANPRGLAIDTAGGFLYWTEPFQLENTAIKRARLDGSDIATVVSMSGAMRNPRNIALDLSGGPCCIYWTDLDGAIYQADLDGSNIVKLVGKGDGGTGGEGGMDHPNGIAIDLSTGKIYWTEPGLNKIMRANLDGTDAEDWITGSLGAHSLAIANIPEPSAGLLLASGLVAIGVRQRTRVR